MDGTALHLHLVPQDPAFDFSRADFNVPIPVEVLALAAEDAPTAETPPGLEDLRSRLTDREAEIAHGEESWPLRIPLRGLAGNPSASVVPLVTPHYAAAKVREVFAAWQSARSHRAYFRLALRQGYGVEEMADWAEEGGPGGACLIALLAHALPAPA
ncbi:MAG: hypothetical protein WA975_24310 [Mesorhizobium sp.]